MTEPIFKTPLITETDTFPNNNSLLLILLQQALDSSTCDLFKEIEKLFMGTDGGIPGETVYSHSITTKLPHMKSCAYIRDK